MDDDRLIFLTFIDELQIFFTYTTIYCYWYYSTATTNASKHEKYNEAIDSVDAGLFIIAITYYGRGPPVFFLTFIEELQIFFTYTTIYSYYYCCYFCCYYKCKSTGRHSKYNDSFDTDLLFMTYTNYGGGIALFTNIVD